MENLSIQDFIRDLSEKSYKIETQRPFLSEDLWSLMYTYQGFIGRSVYLIVDGYKKRKLETGKKIMVLDRYCLLI
jgi:hypothetical protein